MGKQVDVDKLVTIQDMLAMFGTSRTSFYKWIRNAGLPVHRWSNGTPRHDIVLGHIPDLEKWAKANKKAFNPTGHKPERR